MSDLISRADAINAIDNQWLHGVNVPICEEIRTAIVQIISALPSAEADTVEVVRCKDCKHYNEWQNGTGSCQRSDNSCFWFGVDFNDYCSFGERSE